MVSSSWNVCFLNKRQSVLYNTSFLNEILSSLFLRTPILSWFASNLLSARDLAWEFYYRIMHRSHCNKSLTSYLGLVIYLNFLSTIVICLRHKTDSKSFSVFFHIIWWRESSWSRKSRRKPLLKKGVHPKTCILSFVLFIKSFWKSYS